MEVAASLIAIGQAAAAIPTLIETIRAFHGIKGDLAELYNEISAIESHLESVKTTIGGFTAHDVPPQLSLPEPMSLASARNTIHAVCQELRGVASTCGQRNDLERVVNVRRAKWLWKSRNINHLIARLKSSREQLHMALTEMVLLSNQSHGRILLRVETLATAFLENRFSVAGHPQTPEVSATDTTERPNRRHDDISRHYRSKPKGQSYQRTVVRQPSEPRMSTLAKINKKETICIETSTYRPQQCSPRCHCQCHVKRTSYQSPGWLQPLLGSFFLQYDSLPVLSAREKCDLPRCRNSASTIHFRYYFPRRILDRAISVSACIGSSLGGVGASLYLHVPRIIENTDDILLSIRYNRADRFQKLFAQRPYSPVDCNENDQTLLCYAIEWRRYDVVERLLEAWNIGKGSLWSDRVAMAIARGYIMVLSDSLGEREKRVLRRVVELDSAYDEETLTGPQAVFKGIDVLKRFLLQGDPQAVHDTDASDMTALHTACMLGDLEAVQLLIDEGAKLDARNWEGQTPLMIAMKFCKYNCAKVLVDTDCNLGASNKWGYDIVWYTMKGDITPTFEILQHVIANHPKIATSSDIYDHTPLHWLSRVRGPPELAEQLLRLLLQAGVPLESRSRAGLTPLLDAVVKNNGLAVQLLLRAGADPHAAAAYDNNLLHLAAQYAGLDVLQQLTAAEITGVDIDVGAIDEFTPLDCWRWRRYTGYDKLWIRSPRPTVEDTNAFETLLRGVRDRTFNIDIEICEKVLQAVRDQDTSRARELVEPITSVEAGKREYRGCAELRTNVMMQIKGAQWEAAAMELEHLVESRRKRMKISPFQEESRFYGPDEWDSSRNDSESEWETIPDEREEECDDDSGEDAESESNMNVKAYGNVEETERINGITSELVVRERGDRNHVNGRG